MGQLRQKEREAECPAARKVRSLADDRNKEGHIMRTRLSVLLVCLGATCTFAQLRPLGSSIFSEREKDGKARQDIGMSVFNQKSPFPSYTPPVQYYGKSNELKKAVDWVNEKPLLPWQPPKPPPSMFGSMHNSNTIGQMESLYRDRLDEYRKTQEQDRKRLQQH